MRVSVQIPVTRPDDVLRFASLVRWSSAERLWQGHALLTDVYQQMCFAAGAGFRVPTGIGVTLMPLKSPYQAASEARSLALVTGHSVVAAFGPGAPEFQGAMRGGQAYDKPLTASREYVTIVRGLLDGGIVSVDGDYFSVTAQLAPFPKPDVRVGLGVLRAGMARLCGELADVAVTWMAPARYLSEVIGPALAKGHSRRVLAGRAAVSAVTHVALRRPGRDPVALAVAACGQHLVAPHYRDMLGQAGIETSEDVRANAAGLVEGGGFLYGEPDELMASFDELAESGVDELVLNTAGVAALHGPDAAASDLLELVLAWQEHRPAA